MNFLAPVVLKGAKTAMCQPSKLPLYQWSACNTMPEHTAEVDACRSACWDST